MTLNVARVKVVIAGAQPEQCESLNALEMIAWTSETRPDCNDMIPPFERILSINDTLVAILGGHIAGYANVGRRTRIASNSHVFALRAIVVHPNFRRQGIGRQLLRSAEILAQTRGARKISIAVLSTNFQAIKFYCNQGYVQEAVGHREFLICNRFVDNLIMVRWLDETC